MNDFKSLINQKGIILARDQIGFTPLHKATLYRHTELVDFIASNHPETLDARDHVIHFNSFYLFNSFKIRISFAFLQSKG